MYSQYDQNSTLMSLSTTIIVNFYFPIQIITFTFYQFLFISDPRLYFSFTFYQLGSPQPIRKLWANKGACKKLSRCWQPGVEEDQACQKPTNLAGRTSVFQAGKKIKAGLFSKIHTRGKDLKILKFIVEEAWQWGKALINKSLRHLERRGLTFGQGLSQGPFFREHWAKYNFALFEKTKTKGGLQIKCLCSSSAQRPQSRTLLPWALSKIHSCSVWED